MPKPLRVLIVEDSEDDVFLVVRELCRCAYDVDYERVETAEDMRTALTTTQWDVVLSDFSMPRFSAVEALRVLQSLDIDIPFIIVSGTIGEAAAVESLKAGAHDFMAKDNLARLGPAIEREMREVSERRARKRAEAELARKNEELIAMTEQLWQSAKLATVGELTASIAHELNNPLSVMKLQIETMLDDVPLDSSLRGHMDMLDQEVDRMAALVSNLLQFSRRSSKQFDETDIRVELLNTVRLMQAHFRRQNIVVEQDFAPDTPNIVADRQLLRQLFMNLLVNASDATPQGGRIRQCVYPIEIGGTGYVAVEILDTGTGIPADVIGKVFEPFFTTKPAGKGTGLGLTICRRIVQEHGGTLELSSTPGEGLTVRMRFPREQYRTNTA